MVRPRPQCPLHPQSRVWLDGTYGRGERRRQRFRCLPRDGGAPHVFTEPLPRTIAAEHECWECERTLAPHEGPPAPRDYEYTVREIAEALIHVGRGMTYAGATREVRELGGRGRRRADCRRPRRQDGKTVAAWVELFAPTLFEAFRPRVWPPIVALDSLPFAASGNLDELGYPRRGGVPSFHVFAAMGYDGYDQPVRLVGLQSFPGFRFRQGRPYWVEFLRKLNDQLDGAPRQIVCDGDYELMRAINDVWPPGAPGTPEVFLCHHHLRAKLEKTLRRRRIAADDPLYLAAQAAFDNAERWQRFVRLVDEREPAADVRLVQRWLRSRVGQRAAWQVAHRTGRVVDTTAVEQYLAWLRSQFGLRRAGLRNRRRLDRMLMLMLLQQRRPAKRSTYVHVIRETLLARGGHAPRRRQVDGAHSLRLLPPPRRERPSAATTASYPPDPDGEDLPF